MLSSTVFHHRNEAYADDRLRHADRSVSDSEVLASPLLTIVWSTREAPVEAARSQDLGSHYTIYVRENRYGLRGLGKAVCG